MMMMWWRLGLKTEKDRVRRSDGWPSDSELIDVVALAEEW